MRIALPLLLLVTLIAGDAPAAPGGRIEGTVIVVKDGKPDPSASDVYVYLEQEHAESRPGRGLTRQISQRGEQFEPFVTVVPVGAIVAFPNKDLIEHNVFSPSVDTRRIGFDLGRYGTSKTGKAHAFLERGELDIYCDIHMKMRAKVKVVPSRYFAKVVDGTFALAGLPPGKYRVFAWTPDSVDVPSEWVTITASELLTVHELHVHTRPSPVQHKRIDGSDYPYTKP